MRQRSHDPDQRQPVLSVLAGEELSHQKHDPKRADTAHHSVEQVHDLPGDERRHKAAQYHNEHHI